MNKIRPLWLYLAYFVVNIVNALIYTSAIGHSNISNFQRSFKHYLSSLGGDIGILIIFFLIAIVLFKTTLGRVRFLTIVTISLTIFTMFLSSFANIFSLGFSFAQLDSFQNPTQITFLMYYADYALGFIFSTPQNFYLLPLVAFITIRIFTDTATYQHISAYQLLSLLIISIVVITIPMVNYNKKLKGTIYENTPNPLHATPKLGLYNYYVYDLFNYINQKEQPMTNEERNQIIEFLNNFSTEEYINPVDGKTYTRTNEFTNKADGMNLVIIQAEALNNFVIGLEIDGIEITPNLNKLIEKSLYFDNFYASAGIGNTSDSEFSFATGLYGNGNQLTIMASQGKNYHTLVKDFNSKGYSTFSLHGNVGEFYARNTKHPEILGFDYHYDKPDFIEYGIDGPLVHDWINDKDFFKVTAQIMEEQTNPFFAFPITIISHSPYVPSEAIPCNQYNFKEPTKISKNYLEHIIYFDEAIGIFLEELEARNLLDNTVIALFGDHSSSLFKKDLESIMGRKYSDIEFRKEMQKVPFLIYNEKIIEAGVNHSSYSTVDTYATFANLFGLEYTYKFGADMLSKEPGFVYSPRNLDIFHDDFIIEYPKGKITYLNKDKSEAELKKQAENLINYFEYYKRMNDLILKTKYFK